MSSPFFPSRDKTNKRPVSFFDLNPPKQSKSRTPIPKFIPNPSPFFSGVKKFKNTSPVNFSPYPVRTKQETKLIDTNPWRDTDKDGIPNIFDCRPLDGYLQGAIHPVKNRRQQKYRDKKPNQTHGASKGKYRMNRNLLKQKKKSSAAAEAERVRRLKERERDLRHREAIGIGYTRQERGILGDMDIKEGLPLINVGRNKIDMTKAQKKEYISRKKGEKHFHKRKPINKYGPGGALAHLNPKNAENQALADEMNKVVRDNLGNLFYPTGGLKYGASKKPRRENDPNRKTKQKISYVNPEDLVPEVKKPDRRFIDNDGSRIIVRNGKSYAADANWRIIRDDDYIEKSTGPKLEDIKREELLRKINLERQSPEYLAKVNARRKIEGKPLLKNIFPITDNMLRKIGTDVSDIVTKEDMKNSLLQKSTKLSGEKRTPIQPHIGKIIEQIKIKGQYMSEEEALRAGLIEKKKTKEEKATEKKDAEEAEEAEYQRRKGLMGDKKGFFGGFSFDSRPHEIIRARREIEEMAPGLKFGDESEKISEDNVDNTYNQKYFDDFEADYGEKNDYDPTKEAQDFIDTSVYDEDDSGK